MHIHPGIFASEREAELMIDYARMGAEFPKRKAALTRALNKAKKDKTQSAWQAVLTTCAEAEAWMDDIGWPDDWARWQRASMDAQFELRRLGVVMTGEGTFAR